MRFGRFFDFWTDVCLMKWGKGEKRPKKKLGNKISDFLTN